MNQPGVDFDFSEMDPPSPGPLRDDEIKAIRIETITQLLQLLDHGNAKQVGQRLCLLAFLVRASESKTQRDLARRLKLSPGRVSQGLNIARREFALLACGS